MNEIDLFGEPAPAPALAELAAAINAEHQAAERTARKAIEHAKAAGDKLLLAKAQVAHGQWLPWLSTNCPALAVRLDAADVAAIYEAYKERNWTQQTLARELKIARPTLSNVLNRREAPSAELAKRIRVFLEKPIPEYPE